MTTAQKKIAVDEYLQKCRDECGCRLADKSLFAKDSLQQNALRIETLRDMSPRCGEKMRRRAAVMRSTTVLRAGRLPISPARLSKARSITPVIPIVRMLSPKVRA